MYSLWCQGTKTEALLVVGTTRLVGTTFCVAAGNGVDELVRLRPDGDR
jgi:hypothetical protein